MNATIVLKSRTATHLGARDLAILRGQIAANREVERGGKTAVGAIRVAGERIDPMTIDGIDGGVWDHPQTGTSDFCADYPHTAKADHARRALTFRRARNVPPAEVRQAYQEAMEREAARSRRPDDHWD